MTPLRIECLFANRKDSPDVVELLTAWDEYSIDENPEGWEKDKATRIDAVGSELLRWAVATITVDLDALTSMLNPETFITGSVSS